MKIQIGGKERPIHGNMNGLIELKKEHNVDMVNGFSKETISFEAIRSLVFVALKYGYKKESGKTDIDFTLEDVGEWVTPANMNDVLGDVIKSFLGDVNGGKSSDEPGE